MRAAKVYLVGAGPGDAGLITLKGKELLEKADCVIYDSLANEKLLAHAPKHAEAIYVGKKGFSKPRNISQAFINRLIIKNAKMGRTVVRLKGGDPFIFGRGAEEALALVKNEIPFEVVPGVTSALAVPAYAGIPLTHRGNASTVTFLTGHEDFFKRSSAVAWRKLSVGSGTLVILMGWKKLQSIVARLIKNGRDPKTPVAMIRWGTLPNQKKVIATLDTIVKQASRADMKPPVVTVIGEVVGLSKKLDWFEKKPLFGKRVLVTRTMRQASEFTKMLEARGALPISFPVIKTIKPPDMRPLDKGMKKLQSYDWAIFTSVNGVEYFFERLYELGKDVRELYGVKICAIGPATERAITERGINVDIVPKEYKAEGLLKALGRRRIKGKSFLLPRAKEAREILPEEIRRLGGRIDVAPAYKTIKPRAQAARLKKLLRTGEVDVITFTSSSTVKNFMALLKKGEAEALMKDVTIACIGPITAKTAEDLGLTVDITPKSYTLPSLTKALEKFYS
jgi:uroporphyrinogen III methyltransferase/synthase